MEFSQRMRDITVQEKEYQEPSPTTTLSSCSSSSSHWTPPNSSPSSSSAAVTTDQHREHMFEKVVTPSDVGKLNRLVIPKQHAERYFPLDPTSDDHKGGLLLSFEEGPTGRPWLFRYSYWNSSQSYVITKGWSRFVKDKLLHAGDTVLFSRSTTTSSLPLRLFIDWRRRPIPVPPVVPTWSWTIPPWAPPLYFRAVGPKPAILDSVLMRTHGRPGIKPRRQVRLFGVNLECSEEPPSPLQWRLSAAAAMTEAKR